MPYAISNPTRILVLNGGTGSVKAALAEATADRVEVRVRSMVETAAGRQVAEMFADVIKQVGGEGNSIDAIGHRVVHGGRQFASPVLIDGEVEAGIASLVPLAPLHNPVALAGIRTARDVFPGKPMVAVFDTAFHARRPRASLRYGLPPDVTEALGLYRYGFHGIAHASLAAAVAAIEGFTPGDVTAVTLQLGHGCSACAIRNGASIETSMGFTPLEGLVMSTRSGDVDPALVLHLLRNGYPAEAIEELLTRRSGLLGVGGNEDMRVLLHAEAAGDARAAFAIELFVRRIVVTVGAYFTLLGSPAALVFGGGIGENSAEIRRRVVEGLTAWKMRLDPELNSRGTPGRISAAAHPPIYVARTDEETQIARAVAQVVLQG